MEILSNFASIYCYISFVLGAVLMLVSLAIVAMGKDYEPKNKVRFFVVCEEEGNYNYGSRLQLWLRRPIWDEYHKFWKTNNHTARQLGFEFDFRNYGLNKKDFTDMKVGEIREVFLNLED